ncbi:P-loop containing nucleoside triphosphate hydrolase protein, partial [Ascodesmis nigricans]
MNMLLRPFIRCYHRPVFTSPTPRRLFQWHRTLFFRSRLRLQPHSRCFSSLHDRQLNRDEDTIFALSTPPGTSAIAIIRITGSSSLDIYRSLTKSATPPRPRYAHVRPIHHPDTSTILDPGALCLFFPASSSLTGSDTLELHLHGSRAIISAVLTALPLLSARPADPGEFTKRAFHAGKLSLPEVEALGETLAAVTEQQRIRAIRGTSSHLADRYDGWRVELIEARGVLEALIDFADDQGFEESPAELVGRTVSLAKELHTKLLIYTDNAVRGELLRSGISLCFLGAPNAGKSSLLNRIVGREAAIVSPEAGTTRDVVDLAVDVGGYMLLLGDTAGLRSSTTASGKIEIEGMRRARERVRAADIVVAVFDVTEKIPEEVKDALALAHQGKKKIIAVANKTDLLPGNSTTLDTSILADSILPSLPSDTPVISLSCTTGTGIKTLLDTLTSLCSDLTSPLVASGMSPLEAEESVAATQRQRGLLLQCKNALEEFVDMCDGNEEEADVVLAAELLRDAAAALGKVVGRGEQGDVEDVLGVVFEKFCVGK